MNLTEHQLAMLGDAADQILLADIKPYLRLKNMLNQGKSLDQKAFKYLFT
jgi:hypothetical protein